MRDRELRKFLGVERQLLHGMDFGLGVPNCSCSKGELGKIKENVEKLWEAVETLREVIKGLNEKTRGRK